MSNEVMTSNSENVPADYQAPNAFEAYGHKADQGGLPFLKFKDGEYLAGANNIEVPLGTQVLAVVSDLMVGWQRWWGGAPSDEVMGLISEGFTPPRRDTLGDLEEEAWEADPEGRKKDPWQVSNKFPVVFDEDESPIEDGQVLAFTASSRGAIGAIGKMCKEYGQHIRTAPDEYPVIELETDKYYNKTWDRNIKFPVFRIVGWSTLDDWKAGNADPAEPAPKPEPAKTKPKAKTKEPKKRF